MRDLIRREDVDKAIHSICDLCGEDKKYNGVMCGACNLDSFIREYEDLPSAEPEPEEFEWCSRGESPCKEYDQEKHCCHRWTKVIRQTVEELKAYEPERHRGEWIEDGHERGFSECSKCGYIAVSVLSERHYNYCPRCGADMRGEE